MSLFRTTTAAVLGAAAALAFTAPAQAATKPWEVSHAGATASGSHTVVQDPRGVMQTHTLRGAIDTGSAAGCFHVLVQHSGTSWKSPVTCAGAAALPFSTTFRTVALVQPGPTVRLCNATGCGVPSPLR